MLEKEVEKLLTKEVKKLGGLSFKWVSPGNAGVPDRIILIPKLMPVFVELKTDKGKCTRLQEIQQKRIRSVYDSVIVLYGKDDVVGFIATCCEQLAELERRGNGI